MKTPRYPHSLGSSRSHSITFLGIFKKKHQIFKRRKKPAPEAAYSVFHNLCEFRELFFFVYAGCVLFPAFHGGNDLKSFGVSTSTDKKVYLFRF